MCSFLVRIIVFLQRGYTAFMQAAEKHQVEVMKLLIDNSAAAVGNEEVSLR